MIELFRDVKYCMEPEHPSEQLLGVVHAILPKPELIRYSDKSENEKCTLVVSGSSLMLNTLIDDVAKEDVSLGFHLRTEDIPYWEKTRGVILFLYGCEDDFKAMQIQRAIVENHEDLTNIPKHVLEDVIVMKKQIEVQA